MKRVDVDLTIDPFGRHCRVALDGLDISRSVRGFTLSADVHEVTVLTLDMHLIEPTDVSGEVFAQVDADTEAALLALGWIAPGPGVTS